MNLVETVPIRTARQVIVGAVLGLLSVALTTSATAQQLPSLAVPVECDIASVCSIQNYVDAAPGSESGDYTCGTLTYDGHKGTDFQTPDNATMRRGIVVVAATDGIVRAIRDGVSDNGIEAWRRSERGKELGNAVALSHDGGWETLYGHLRKGSITVKAGDRVRKGQAIGLIGYSGKTEFPHLHFQLMQNGRAVDPFSGLVDASGCGVTSEPLWSQPALSRLGYRATLLLCGGLAVSKPERAAIRDDCRTVTEARRDAGALVVFAEFGGVQAGDRIRLAIFKPDGRPLIDNEASIDKTGARRFRYVGRKRPAGLWQAGAYSARLVLTRRIADRDQVLIDVGRSLVVR